MFKRCLHCGNSKGLTKEDKQYICTVCTAIHTLNEAKAAAKLTNDEWEKHSARQKEKYDGIKLKNHKADKLELKV